ncbi:hypothetical protein GCM10009839_59700 [Catenulispora yoronensis]|uniref:Adhesin domain-containing protein n=1 Tax=Catenulispora yoronensis TaxID=450799 RepID=A0ABN2V0Q2_9ACTN
MTVPAKTPEPAPARRPIPMVRISTVALLGLVAAVTIPAAAATVALSGSLDAKQQTVPIQQTGPVSKVVIDTADGSVTVIGDPTMSGVSGQADLQWHSFTQAPLRLDQKFENGVLMLSRSCLKADCGGATITVRVPPSVAVDATTSNSGVSVTGVNGGVKVVTSNAGIDVKDLGNGDVDLHTSNGGVDARFAGAPKTILIETSNAHVKVVTDGRTPYYDEVHTSNGQPDLENVIDRYTSNTIRVFTSNEDVEIR